MPTYKGLFTTNRAHTALLRGTWTTAQYSPPVFQTDTNFIYNTILLSNYIGNTKAFNSDASLNNFNINVFGDAKASRINPYGTNWSNYFNGSTDYLSSTNINFGTNNFTIEGWFWPTTIANLTNFWGTDNGSGSTPKMLMYINSGGNLTIDMGNVGTTQFPFAVSAATYLKLYNWNHIAVVRSGLNAGQFALYINGVSIATGQLGTNISGITAVFNIGYIGEAYGQTFGGYISNFRVVNGDALYTTNFTPSSTPLTAIANTSLLACQSNKFKDNSVNNRTFTIGGTPAVNAFNPFDTGSSYSNYGSASFDGTGDYLTIPGNSSFALGTGDFTFEVWLYANSISTGTFDRICATSDYNGAGFDWTLNTSASAFYLAGTSYNIGSITPKIWHHLAYTRSGSTIRGYLNGNLSSTATGATQNISSTAQLNIGSGYSGTNLNGYLSDLRIIRGTAIYSGNFTPPTAPLLTLGTSSTYSSTANVNVSFSPANVLLLTAQYKQPHNNSTFLDSSNQNQVIVRAGNAPQGAFSPYGDRWSNYFDGDGDSLTMPTNAAFAFGTDDFTIETWAYSLDTSGSSQRCIFDTRSSSGSGAGLFLRENAATNGFILGIASSAVFTTSSGRVPNTWQHLAIVRISGVVYFYVNGVLSTSTSFTTNLTDIYARISGFIDTFADPYAYKGYLSNLRVVKGTGLYTSAFTPSTTPLTAISGTSLLTCQNNRFIDNSTNNFALTRSGDVSIQRFSPYIFTANASPTTTGGSVFFDGTGDYLNIPAPVPPGFLFRNNDFTVEFWTYKTSIAGCVWVGNFNNNTTANGIWTAYYYQAGQVSFFWNTGGLYQATFTLLTNTWYHIAFTRQGTSIKIFINGVQIGTTGVMSADVFTTYDQGGGYQIGRSSDNAALLTGYMSDLRVINGTAIYTGNFTPPTLPLQLAGNAAIYPSTANVNTTFTPANTALLLNFTDAAIKDATGIVNLETATDAKIAYEMPYAGSYYSNYFDGAGDWQTLATSTALGFGTGDFTVDGWFYLTATPATNSRGMWHFNSAINGTVNGYGMGFATSRAIEYYAGATFTTTTAIVNLNQWYHVAMIKSAGTVRVYLNGVSISSIADAQNITTAVGSIGIWYNSATTGTEMTGYISNLRVEKGTAIYTAAFTPPTTPPTATANTSLLTCQSKSFVDNSTNRFAITVTGQTAVKSFNPFIIPPGNSMFFDGTGDYLITPNSPALSFGTSNLTIDFWFYGVAAQGGTTHLVGNNLTYGTNAWEIQWSNGSPSILNKLQLWAYNLDTGAVFMQGTTTLTPNTWYHAALVRNGAAFTLYLNGLAEATRSSSTALDGSTNNLICLASRQGAENFNGYINDLRITRGNVRYTANFTPTINGVPIR